MATKTYLQAISDGLREEMRSDERVFLMGEDVGAFGGAFKVTDGLAAEFGEQRVQDTPLAESANKQCSLVVGELNRDCLAHATRIVSACHMWTFLWRLPASPRNTTPGRRF